MTHTAASVTIAATNTVEGAQTVAPGVATTWTPTRAGPIRFSLVRPGRQPMKIEAPPANAESITTEPVTVRSAPAGADRQLREVSARVLGDGHVAADRGPVERRDHRRRVLERRRRQEAAVVGLIDRDRRGRGQLEVAELAR